MDADGSGVIDYTEWIASTLNMKQYFQEDVLWAAFKVFDRDGARACCLKYTFSVCGLGTE